MSFLSPLVYPSEPISSVSDQLSRDSDLSNAMYSIVAIASLLVSFKLVSRTEGINNPAIKVYKKVFRNNYRFGKKYRILLHEFLISLEPLFSHKFQW